MEGWTVAGVVASWIAVVVTIVLAWRAEKARKAAEHAETEARKLLTSLQERLAEAQEGINRSVEQIAVASQRKPWRTTWAGPDNFRLHNQTGRSFDHIGIAALVDGRPIVLEREKGLRPIRVDGSVEVEYPGSLAERDAVEIVVAASGGPEWTVSLDPRPPRRSGVVI